MADHRYTDADDVIDATHLGWDDRIYAGAGNDTVKLGPLVACMSEAGNDTITGDGTGEYVSWSAPRRYTSISPPAGPMTATADAIPCRASAPYTWGALAAR